MKEKMEACAANISDMKKKLSLRRRLKELKVEEVRLKALVDKQLQSATENSELGDLLKAISYGDVRMASDKIVNYEIVGATPKSCVRLLFQINKVISCEATVEPTLFPSHRFAEADRLAGAGNFVSRSTQHICEKASTVELKSLHDLRLSIQSIECDLRRVDAVADELSSLKKMFKSSLAATGASDFQFEVDFCYNDTEVVTALFIISGSYPHAPLGISINLLRGSLDVPVLLRLLKKHTKPGFLYLTDVCNYVQAFITATYHETSE